MFGPVLSVIPFDTEEEAIALANDSRYGLAGAVWTKDIHRGHRVAHAMRTGTVWINAYRVVGPDVPFGGYGLSGSPGERHRGGARVHRDQGHLGRADRRHPRPLHAGMSAPEVAIVVHYQAMAGKGDEVAALLARHTAATRAEPGNLDFVALRSSEDPDAFVLYERYSSGDAFKAHQASPHFEGIAVAQIRPLLGERTRRVCQVVEPDGTWVRSTRSPS